MTLTRHERVVLSKLREQGVNIKTATPNQIKEALKGTVLAKKNIQVAMKLRRKNR